MKVPPERPPRSDPEWPDWRMTTAVELVARCGTVGTFDVMNEAVRLLGAYVPGADRSAFAGELAVFLHRWVDQGLTLKDMAKACSMILRSTGSALEHQLEAQGLLDADQRSADGEGV